MVFWVIYEVDGLHPVSESCAWIAINGKVFDYFADRIHETDIEILSLSGNGSEDQQTLGALALLACFGTGVNTGSLSE